MARDCIFYSEDNDMGATIPFCDFEDSSDWNCCKYYDHRGSTQELCPHYISMEYVRETLRKSFTEEAGAHRRITRREKWLKKLQTDRYIEAMICDASRNIKDDCPDCPIKKMCKSMYYDANDYNKYMAAVSKWLDEEAEDDVFEKENALKLIDTLVSVNDTLRREIVMSDAIMSIGKEKSYGT